MLGSEKLAWLVSNILNVLFYFHKFCVNTFIAITGLLSLCKQCANENLSLFTPDLVKRIMTGIAQQSVEKIDRTRAHAGKTFTSLLYWLMIIFKYNKFYMDH